MEPTSYQDIPEEYATPSFQEVNEEKSVSIIKQLSPQEHLKEQIAWLEGKVWDEQRRAFVEIPGVKPFMNQEGRDMFFQYATAVLSPIVTFSNFKNETSLIHRLVSAQINDATIHFHLHWNDYEIRRKTQIKVLISKLRTLGLAAFYKALGAGDRNAGTRNIHENISSIMRNFGEGGGGQVPQGQSWVTKMNPFNRR